MLEIFYLFEFAGLMLIAFGFYVLITLIITLKRLDNDLTVLKMRFMEGTNMPPTQNIIQALECFRHDLQKDLREIDPNAYVWYSISEHAQNICCNVSVGCQYADKVKTYLGKYYAEPPIPIFFRS